MVTCGCGLIQPFGSWQSAYTRAYTHVEQHKQENESDQAYTEYMAMTLERTKDWCQEELFKPIPKKKGCGQMNGPRFLAALLGMIVLTGLYGFILYHLATS